MIHVLNYVEKCLLGPYALLFVIFGIILVFLRRSLSLYICILLIVFALLWRSLFKISTSRYCAVFLLILPIMAAYAIKGSFFKYGSGAIKKIVFIPFVCLFVFNIIATYHSFRNNYVFDIKEDVDKMTNVYQESVFLIPRKEIERLGHFKKEITGQIKDYDSSSMDVHSLQEFYQLYDFGQKNSYVFISERYNQSSEVPNHFILGRKKVNSHKIRHYYTNRKKNNAISIYSFKQVVPPFFCDKDFRCSPLGSKILNEGILEVFQPDYDVYIFRLKNKLIWFIGTEIDKSILILYSMFTSQPNLLPADRIKYGFDNRSFKADSKYELERLGKYRVFEREIPTEYPINYIRVGFYFSGEVKWSWRIYLNG